MATLKSTACRCSGGRLAYIFNEPAHNTILTGERVLACGGLNIDLLTDEDNHVLSEQSGVYLEQQFHQVLQKAKNPKRKYQCQSIIVSFSREEFDTSDLQEQAKQASKIIRDFTKKYLGDTQNVYAIAADGDGGKLHCHLLVNTIKPDGGKTVPTSRFTVFKLRRQLNQYLEQNFQRVTGRPWANPFNKPEPREDQNNLVTKSEWQKQLKLVLDDVKSKVASISEYINELKQRGITITQRNKKGDWTYHQEINGKDYKVRDFYQRIDKETGEVKSTRGLGKSYTPNDLERSFKVKGGIKNDRNKDKEFSRKDEEYERVKLLAREAKQRTLERQIKDQQNLQRLRAAKNEEKRKAERKDRRANQQRQQSRYKDRSKQQRYQGRNQQQNDGPEL